MRRLDLLLAAAFLVAVAGTWFALDARKAAELAALRPLYARPAAIPAPSDNPTTPEKVALGARLFRDKRLSASGTLSCASCHDPVRGFSDGRERAVGDGGRVLERRSPTLWNLAWAPVLFWDGRAATLEAQAAMPIEAHGEMNQPLGPLTDRLAADPSYRAAFARAFPEEPAPSPRNIIRALAAHERTLVAPRTPFDAWVEGDDSALTAGEKRGLLLFHGKAGCATCHQGWAFTDHGFYDIGLPDASDRGRGAVLGQPRVDHAFRTPTLREIGRRGPFMHDGSLPTLEAVLDHYERGVVDRPTLPPELPRQLTLTSREREELLAFLGTLSAAGEAPPAPAAMAFAAPESAAAPAVASARVAQRERRFDPGRVVIEAGTLLEISNDEAATVHNVRIDDARMRIDSGVQDPGETVAIAFPEPGTYRAFCAIHTRMRLEVEVRPQAARIR
jgi:cytochrome c peroxidase